MFKVLNMRSSAFVYKTDKTSAIIQKVVIYKSLQYTIGQEHF